MAELRDLEISGSLAVPARFLSVRYSRAGRRDVKRMPGGDRKRPAKIALRLTRRIAQYQMPAARQSHQIGRGDFDPLFGGGQLLLEQAPRGGAL